MTSRDPDCVFCKIVAAELQAQVVYEEEGVLAFLDIGPLAEGHLLVIPRDHHERLSQMPPKTLATVASALPILARSLLKVTKADGFNLLLNEGRVAGQVVPHAHFHLIPRKAGDNLGYRWNAGKYPPGRDAQIAAAYQAVISARDS